MEIGKKIKQLRCKAGLTQEQLASRLGISAQSVSKWEKRRKLEKEKEILMAQIKNDEKNANKPDAIIAKMVEGRIGKFYEQNCLVNQEFIKNGDQTVAQYIAEAAKAAGGEITILSFIRYERGEGIEKRQDDFAAEIAKML